MQNLFSYLFALVLATIFCQAKSISPLQAKVCEKLREYKMINDRYYQFNCEWDSLTHERSKKKKSN